MQLTAAAPEPFIARDGVLGPRAPTLLFPNPEFAKVLIGLNLMPQFPDDELDHDCIIQETEAWNMIGDQVLRLREVG